MKIPLDTIETMNIDLRNVDTEKDCIKLSWYVSSSWNFDVIELGKGSCSYNGKVSVDRENDFAINVLAYASGEEDFFPK